MTTWKRYQPIIRECGNVAIGTHLSRATGESVEQVRKNLRELCAKGLLTRQGKRWYRMPS